METLYKVKTHSGLTAEYPCDPRAERTVMIYHTYKEAADYAEQQHALTGEDLWVSIS